MELKFDKKDMYYAYATAFNEGISYALTHQLDTTIALETGNYKDEAMPYFWRYLRRLIERIPHTVDISAAHFVKNRDMLEEKE